MNSQCESISGLGSRKRKISVLLPDLRGGGVERMRLNLCREWTKLGYVVELVLLSRTGELLPLIPSDISLVELGVSRLRASVGPLQRYLKHTKPDILLAAMWPLTSLAIFAWIIAGRPGKVFVSDHTQLSISAVRELQTPVWLLRLLMGFSYPVADGIIAVSEGVKQDISSLACIDAGRIRVIHNPAAPGAPAPGSSIRPELARRERKNILAVGSLKDQKDFATLIHAFRVVATNNAEAHLTILGEGALRPELEELVKKLRLQDMVSMPGFVRDPTDWYLSSDLFVLSSRWEGFGNVIVEALHCGVPVVSTDCQSGPSEILENGRYGTLVPVGDVQALATAITQALERPHDKELLQQRAKEFSAPFIAVQYLNYFGEASA